MVLLCGAALSTGVRFFFLEEPLLDEVDAFLVASRNLSPSFEDADALDEGDLRLEDERRLAVFDDLPLLSPDFDDAMSALSISDEVSKDKSRMESPPALDLLLFFFFFFFFFSSRGDEDLRQILAAFAGDALTLLSKDDDDANEEPKEAVLESDPEVYLLPVLLKVSLLRLILSFLRGIAFTDEDNCC